MVKKHPILKAGQNTFYDKISLYKINAHIMFLYRRDLILCPGTPL